MALKLPNKIVKILQKKRIKISLAESCTGGMLSSQITSVKGASKIFSLGIVSYSNQSKIKTLKVPKKTILKFGAVSKECCLSMARNIQKISKSDISLSITGIAGPDGGTTKKPVGLVYVGICKKSKIDFRKYFFNNKLTRIQIQKKTCIKALKLIEEFL